MFTGLIEAVGSVQSISAGEKSMRIAISFPSAAWELEMGESVNVDGVCQTVVAAGASTFTVEAVGDTLQKTTFRTLRRGAKVNLERALRADGRFGGHMVMGHVAGTARIVSWGPGRGAASPDSQAWFLSLELEPSWADRVVPEGSMAVDGVSLTVAEVAHGPVLPSGSGLRARLSIIPHTRKATTLALKKVGDLVNIELDILASYARAAMRTASTQGPGVTREQLSSWGYT